MNAIARELVGCFHCGLPLPDGLRWHARIDGIEQDMCCPGCAAAAQAIVDAGCDAYYATRPRGSQLGAWASEQSQPVESVEELTSLYAIAETRLADVEEIPMPDRWGGYRLRPDRVEFWQGRADRMHDRLRFVRDDEEGGGWVVQRLAP